MLWQKVQDATATPAILLSFCSCANTTALFRKGLLG